MKLSVVIPTCNRNDLLSNCLDLFDKSYQTYSGDYEVLVTDDSRGAGAKELIKNKYPQVKWIEGPKRGPAANRNNGADHVSGEWIVFIDDDCLPDKNLLLNYSLAISAKPEINVFEGCIIADRPQLAFNEESPINITGGHLWSCNFAIKRDLFFSLQGFDDKFPYAAMEDVEFNYRLKKSGVEIFFVKDAYVIHPWRLQKATAKKTYERFQSSAYFLRKHPEMTEQLNFLYNARIAVNGIKSLIVDSFKYRFRGFGSKFIYILMQCYFSLYKLFNMKGYLKR